MLITCPECSRNVSDKANICPGCGYPIQPKEEKATKPAKKIYKKKVIVFNYQNRRNCNGQSETLLGRKT